MSENPYIQKRQRARNKPFLTVRHIMLLVFLSAAVAAGFYFEYGGIDDGTCEGPCEGLYSLQAYALAFAMIFGTVIGAGAVIGGLIALLRWRRNRQGDNLSSLINNAEEKE